jgi:uncharacterized protein (UPF0276 family)
MKDIRIGAAIEFGTNQYDEMRISHHIGFLEYGLQIWRGIPEWFLAMKSRYNAPLHLHPLDINLAADDLDNEWCEKLSELVMLNNVSALVTDAGFWYLGHRSAVWARPSDLTSSAKTCRATAARIAKRVGIPFRIENPPIEWAPARSGIWHFLDDVTDAEGLEICLDVSHLRQYERNVLKGSRSIPSYFPWERVKEIHIAGYTTVEYRGQKRCIDQHLAEIGEDQLEIMAQVVEKADHRIDICLEMEPRTLADFERNAERVLSILNVH